MRLVITIGIAALGSGCASISDPNGSMGTYRLLHSANGWQGWVTHYAGRPPECTMSKMSTFSQPARPFFRSGWPTINLHKNSIQFYVAIAQSSKSSPVVIVDSQKFSLVSQGEFALPPDKRTEKELINAMKAGSKAIVKSLAQDGTLAEDHYTSLGMISAALDIVNTTCAKQSAQPELPDPPLVIPRGK
jgi:hypothetical protein